MSASGVQSTFRLRLTRQWLAILGLKMQSSKGKHTERVCNRYTKDRQVPTERKPEHIEIISYVRFRRAHADSHAAVVAQLSIRSPPKLSLAAAFACVEISPSVVVAIQPHKKKPILRRTKSKSRGTAMQNVYTGPSWARARRFLTKKRLSADGWDCSQGKAHWR